MTDDDFDFTGATAPQDGTDKRGNLRLFARAKVTIEMEAADPQVDLPARIIECQTRDLSANGVQVTLSEPLPEGSILPLEVMLEDDYARFQIMGEVIWCRREQERVWAVGFHVMESDETSVIEWNEAIARAMASQ